MVERMRGACVFRSGAEGRTVTRARDSFEGKAPAPPSASMYVARIADSNSCRRGRREKRVSVDFFLCAAAVASPARSAAPRAEGGSSRACRRSGVTTGAMATARANTAGARWCPKWSNRGRRCTPELSRDTWAAHACAAWALLARDCCTLVRSWSTEDSNWIANWRDSGKKEFGRRLGRLEQLGGDGFRPWAAL